MTTSVAASVAVPSLQIFALQTGFLLVAVCTFRVWDDLADRAFDRIHHPGRVLADSERLLPYIAAVVLGLATLVILLRDEPARATVLLAYASIAALVYHTAPGRHIERPLRTGMVLAKYPLFVLLLVPASHRAWIASGALLLVLAIHECRSDSEFRRPDVLQLGAALAPGAAMIAALHLFFGVLS